MKRKSNGHALYKAYIFKDRDPVIDELHAMAEKHFGHTIGGRDIAQINRDGGPSTGCIRAWFSNKTKRPRNDTIEAAGRAMGYERTWRRMRRNEP
jgi:hypothetical protein